MRNTLIGLGLAVALLAGGCSQAEAPGATPSPRSTTAQLDANMNDVANVDLSQTGDLANEGVDGSGTRMPLPDTGQPGNDLSNRNVAAPVNGAVGMDEVMAKNNRDTDRDVASMTEAKTGQQIDGTSLSEQIAMKALQGNSVEQALGEMAMERSANREVEEAARMIASDHKKAEGELRKATLTALPQNPQLNAEQKALQAKLERLSGAEFDKAYINAMVMAHEKDLAMYKQQSKIAPTEALRLYFTETTPVIERHLKHCRGLQAKLAG